VTVVFFDLRGFTAFAETTEPSCSGAEMGSLIPEHEGTLERFTGDGMMIFFNDPVLAADPAERATRIAVAMRDRVAHLGSHVAQAGSRPGPRRRDRPGRRHHRHRHQPRRDANARQRIG
jgi:adenylate cyclase